MPATNTAHGVLDIVVEGKVSSYFLVQCMNELEHLWRTEPFKQDRLKIKMAWLRVAKLLAEREGMGDETGSGMSVEEYKHMLYQAGWSDELA
mgnify:CR=1 FL=1